ncbi:MAG: cyanoexosortase A [Leptolyngbya sp. RL_3_1]|nr:cyanoexosortase A [Leptolyngbya sp. RL_3_1]
MSGLEASSPHLRCPGFVLLALLTALLVIYGGLLLRYDDMAHLGMSGLFILGAGTLLWDRRHQLTVGSSGPAVVMAAGLSLLVLLISAYLLQQYSLYADQIAAGQGIAKPAILLMRSLPLLSGLAVGLLGLGFRGLKQVWRELVILVALGLPGILAAYTVDISPMTARFSTALLWYAGFDVIRDNLTILLEGGGVEVYAGCSGLESMAYLLGLSLLCLIMFPLQGWKRYWIPLVGVVLGFVINGFRVALMAVLVAAGKDAAFNYWHTGDGSLLFGLAAVLAFGGFYMAIQTLEQSSGLRLADVAPPREAAPSATLLAFLEQEDDAEPENEA